MAGLGTLLRCGVGKSPKRRSRDQYFTPTAGIDAFLQSPDGPVLRRYGAAWEPACGDGRLARRMEEFGLSVVSTDLVTGTDFLSTRELLAPAILSNPPFALADRFVLHAMRNLDAPFLALLLKSTYWHADNRWELWQEWRPSAVYPLMFRLDFTGEGSPPMDCSWYVWKRDHIGPTTFMPLLRPDNAEKRRKDDRQLEASL